MLGRDLPMKVGRRAVLDSTRAEYHVAERFSTRREREVSRCSMTPRPSAELTNNIAHYNQESSYLRQPLFQITNTLAPVEIGITPSPSSTKSSSVAINWEHMYTDAFVYEFSTAHHMSLVTVGHVLGLFIPAPSHKVNREYEHCFRSVV